MENREGLSVYVRTLSTRWLVVRAQMVHVERYEGVIGCPRVVKALPLYIGRCKGIVTPIWDAVKVLSAYPAAS